MRRHLHRGVLPTAGALAAAMGVGRFVYTPILPLMTGQAGLTAHAAGQLATANYVGYLAGAVATTLSARLAHSALACRTALIAIVVSLAAMPMTTQVPVWLTARTVAGFASAVVFVVAVNTLLERLPEKAGWGFGGVGAGIAVSAALVLALPTDDWRTAWWAATGLAALLGATGWWLRPQRTRHTTHAARIGAAVHAFFCCSPRTRWRASATSSPARSWSPRWPSTPPARWGPPSGWSSAWLSFRPQRCGLDSAFGTASLRCSPSPWRCRPRGSRWPVRAAAPPAWWAPCCSVAPSSGSAR